MRPSVLPLCLRLVISALVAVLLLGVTGCSKRRLLGLYEDTSGKGAFQRIEFQPDGRALLTIAGVARETIFSLDGGQVTIKAPGTTWVLRLESDGCLTDESSGRYCPQRPVQMEETEEEKAATGLSGTYVARLTRERVLTLNFTSPTEFTLTIVGDNANTRLSGTYELQVRKLFLKVAGDNEPQEFTIRDSLISGTVDDEAVVFAKE